MILESVITCPYCATAKAEVMPADACQFVYNCTGCGAILRPKHGDCCVFCSYGSVPCPAIQAQRSGGPATRGINSAARLSADSRSSLPDDDNLPHAAKR